MAPGSLQARGWRNQRSIFGDFRARDVPLTRLVAVVFKERPRLSVLLHNKRISPEVTLRGFEPAHAFKMAIQFLKQRPAVPSYSNPPMLYGLPPKWLLNRLSQQSGRQPSRHLCIRRG